ncbi:MAG TPA: hypothetical protein VGD50_02490 [Candidatus Baltobacteraceae bacterium]
MKSAVYNRLLVALTAALLAVYVAAEVAIDPFGIFGIAHFNRKNFQPNTRFAEISYLEHHPDLDVDAYVLGSSRANFYSVETLDRVTGFHFYNMAAPSENSIGIYRKVKWLLAHRTVREVVIPLVYDFYNMTISDWNLSLLDHPDVTGENKLLFYGKNLLISSDLLFKCLTENLRHTTDYTFDVREARFDVNSPREPLIVPDHWMEGKRFGVDGTLDRAEALGYLRDSLALLDAHHVRHIVFINPYSSVLQRAFDPLGYAAWRRDVAAIAGDVWDFGSLNSVTRVDANYSDFSHFRRYVGDWAIERIFGEEGARVPPDFGVFVRRVASSP